MTNRGNLMGCLRRQFLKKFIAGKKGLAILVSRFGFSFDYFIVSRICVTDGLLLLPPLSQQAAKHSGNFHLCFRELLEEFFRLRGVFLLFHPVSPLS